MAADSSVAAESVGRAGFREPPFVRWLSGPMYGQIRWRTRSGQCIEAINWQPFPRPMSCRVGRKKSAGKTAAGPRGRFVGLRPPRCRLPFRQQPSTRRRRLPPTKAGRGGPAYIWHNGDVPQLWHVYLARLASATPPHPPAPAERCDARGKRRSATTPTADHLDVHSVQPLLLQPVVWQPLGGGGGASPEVGAF